MIAYGALGLPLAMAALPLYVQLPAYFAGTLGVPLATVGIVFIAARLADTLPDPWLGRWADHLASTGRLRWAMVLAAAGLALAFAALWRPPTGVGQVALWLGAMLALASVCHTFLQVSHLGWGARLGDAADRIRAATWREGLGLVGVVAASALPVALLSGGGRMPRAYPALFAGLLVVALVLLLRRAPAWRGAQASNPVGVRAAAARPAVRALLPAYFVNALAVAVPATLVMFFVQDRLGAPRVAGLFLVLYFVAGALGMPVWSRVARRVGPTRAWRAGMLSAAAVFVWAGLLGPGDVVAFGAVCVLSGLLLGADLALPPVLLAQRIPPDDAPGAYYGVWMLLGKLAIAGAGATLPVLAALGYVPGHGAPGAEGTGWLAFAYAGVPCALKLAAAALLPAPPPEPNLTGASPCLPR